MHKARTRSNADPNDLRNLDAAFRRRFASRPNRTIVRHALVVPPAMPGFRMSTGWPTITFVAEHHNQR